MGRNLLPQTSGVFRRCSRLGVIRHRARLGVVCRRALLGVVAARLGVVHSRARLQGPPPPRSSATAPASGVVRHVAVEACLRVAAGQPPDLAVGEGVMVIVPVGSGEEGSRGRRLWKDEREPWSPPRRLWKGNGWCDRV
ncbi:hypothetical protein OsI_38107 [Oryza sativa Indica Group]|uniref:Uncharacterized protein n=1 Tax=Oryza sativa subsp. indica TaxID=39946 RepID=A2ZJW1_ORYSI|nr:hypothetical protein OsI_38107 [Oryza sativa Indica Group]